MRQQPESRKSEGGPLDLKDYLRIWRRPQTCVTHCMINLLIYETLSVLMGELL